MITSPGSPDVAAPAVALVLRNQVTRFGVEHILGLLPEMCRINAEIDGAHVLITAFNDIAQDGVAAALSAARDRGTKVLMLVDSAAGVDISRAAGLHCDGFLDVDELTAETMADALCRVARGDVPMP